MMNQENPIDETIQPSPSLPSKSEAPLPNIDRISNLPDPILHHIINFLPTKSAIRTSVLSKQFEAIWLNSSTIDLNENQCLQSVVINDDNNNDIFKKKPREMFLRSLKRYFFRHNLQLLQKLKLHVKQIIYVFCYEFNDFFLWVDLLLSEIAKESFIREIDLKFRIPDETESSVIPIEEMFYNVFYKIDKIYFFSWQRSLTSLKLKGCNFEAIESVCSDDIKFPFLKELFVSHCLIGDDALIPNLISGCPELEDLTMQYMWHVDTIKFDHIKLIRLIIGCDESSTIFEINAPSLQEFEFKGAPWSSFSDDREFVGVRFRPHHAINAPNLQSLVVKYAEACSVSIRAAVAIHQNIKKMVFQWCFFPTELLFSSRNLETLMLSDCGYAIGEGRLALGKTTFPNLKFLSLSSCWRLEELVVQCPTLVKIVVEKCGDFRRYRLITPSGVFELINTAER